MAEEDILMGAGTQVKAAVSTGADFLVIIIAAVVVLAVIAVVVLLLMEMKKYKHRVVIRYITSQGRKKIIHDKAKEYIKDEVPYWKFMKMKWQEKIPESEATEIMDNGCLFAECYYSPTGGIQWIKDLNKAEQGFEEFTTQQRALYAQRIENAKLRKKKGIWELIKDMLPVIILVMIFVLLLVFWKDVSEPMRLVSEQNANAAASMAKITELQARITAVLLGEANITTLRMEQNIPGVSGSVVVTG